MRKDDFLYAYDFSEPEESGYVVTWPSLQFRPTSERGYWLDAEFTQRWIPYDLIARFADSPTANPLYKQVLAAIAAHRMGVR